VEGEIRSSEDGRGQDLQRLKGDWLRKAKLLTKKELPKERLRKHGVVRRPTGKLCLDGLPGRTHASRASLEIMKSSEV
jgi:hypothetical protein